MNKHVVIVERKKSFLTGKDLWQNQGQGGQPYAVTVEAFHFSFHCLQL